MLLLLEIAPRDVKQGGGIADCGMFESGRRTRHFSIRNPKFPLHCPFRSVTFRPYFELGTRTSFFTHHYG
jgi:hypothetical protein